MLVGVTGNFACGKSAFMHTVSTFGFTVFYTDGMVKKLYKDEAIIKTIGREFGKSIIFNSQVDKDLLTLIVFNDKEKLNRLNTLIHPLIIKKIKEIKHKKKIVFVEVPLLFEAKMEELFNKIILVKCTKKTAKKRALKKGYGAGEFEKIISSQDIPELKISKSDYVIDSEGIISKTRKQAIEIIEKLKGELK